MQLVPLVHHAVEQPAVLVGQLVVDVQVANVRPSARRARFGVDLIDLRHHGHVVVARKDRRQDDRRARRAAAGRGRRIARQAARDVGDLGGRRRAVRRCCWCRPGSRSTFGLTPSSSPFSRRQRMFSVLSAPQPKLAAFQPKKFWRQLRQEFGIVGRAPATRDRIADEVDVDASGARFLEQLRVGDHRVLIGPRRGRSAGPCGAGPPARAGARRSGSAAIGAQSPRRRGPALSARHYRAAVPLTAGACSRNLSAHGMKYFQFGPSVCPPSCWRQAR